MPRSASRAALRLGLCLISVALAGCDFSQALEVCRELGRCDRDGGVGDVADAGNDVADAGNDVADAGNDVVDAGNDVADAGNDVVDAGNDVVDAGNDVVDAGDGGSRVLVIARLMVATTDQGAESYADWQDSDLAVMTYTNGEFVSYPVSSSGDKRIATGMPAGDVLLRTSSSWVVSSADSIDLGSATIGRPDVGYIKPGSTSLALTVTGLGTWTVRDRLLFFSAGAGLYGGNTGPAAEGGALVTGPAIGAVADAFTFDYGSVASGGSQRVDATKGDVLYASRMTGLTLVTTEVPVPGDGGTLDVPYACEMSTAGARASAVTVSPPALNLSIAFVTTPTITVGVTLPRSTWYALAPRAHPAAQAVREAFYIGAMPIDDGGSAYPYPDLLVCENDAPAVLEDINRSLQVANPYPATWPLVQDYWVALETPPIDVADAGRFTSRGMVGAARRAGQPMMPVAYPPSHLSVQAIDGTKVTTVAAASQLAIAWRPPEGGQTPSAYQVHVVQVARRGGGGGERTIASVDTPRTSFTFPAGLLQIGGVYFVNVRAIVAPYDPERHPWLDARPRFFAEAFTSPFLAQ